MPNAFDETISEVGTAKEQEAAQPDISGSPAPAETDLQTLAAEPSGEQAQEVEAKAETEDPEFESYVAERKATHGDTWAIKTARELFREKGKNKSVLDLAQTHGQNAFRVGAPMAAVLLDPSSDGKRMAEVTKGSLPLTQYNKLRDEMYGSTVLEFPDTTVRVLYGQMFPNITDEEIQQAVKEFRQYGPQGEQATDTLAELPDDVKRKLAEYDKMTARLPDLEKRVNTYEEQGRNAQVQTLGAELFDSIWNPVSEKIKGLNLEVKPTDSVQVRGIKEALNNRLSKEALETAFIRDKVNADTYVKAIDYVKLLDKKSAFAYQDELLIGADRTLQDVLGSPEVSSLLAALKSEATSQSTPRNATARQELVQGATAPAVKTDAFDEVMKESNLSPFEAAVELAGRRQFARQ